MPEPGLTSDQQPVTRWTYTGPLKEAAADNLGGFTKQAGEESALPSTEVVNYLGRHVIARDTPINKGVYLVAFSNGE